MSETTRLSDFLTEALLNQHYVGEVLTQSHYSVAECRILLLLSLKGCDDKDSAGMRIGEIAETLSLTASSISGTVSEMEGRGLVARKGSVRDAKAVSVVLLEAARELLASMYATIYKQTSFIWEHYSAQEVTLLRRICTAVLTEVDIEAARVDGLSTQALFSAAMSTHARYAAKRCEDGWGLSFLQGRILLLLHELERGVKMSDLAWLLGVAHNFVTPAVRYLERVRKYIVKTRDSEDRRVFIVELTDAGEKEALELYDRYVAYWTQLLESIDSDLNSMLALATARSTDGARERMLRNGPEWLAFDAKNGR